MVVVRFPGSTPGTHGVLTCFLNILTSAVQIMRSPGCDLVRWLEALSHDACSQGCDGVLFVILVRLIRSSLDHHDLDMISPHMEANFGSVARAVGVNPEFTRRLWSN